MQKDLKKIISTFFWETGAIKVSIDNPFKMTSGKLSPFYIDCRILISFPFQRDIINSYAQRLVVDRKIEVDYIAGGETAGIPFAAWLAEKMYKPFIYVRKQPKGHGLSSQVEGKIDPGKKVLLYEDLITDGLSKINFIQGLRNAGCNTQHCLVLLDRQEGGEEKLSEVDVKLHALVTIDQCFEVGLERDFLSVADMDSIQAYFDKGKI